MADVELSTLGSVIKTAYDGEVPAADQAEMEAGTETAILRMSPLRIAQAIDAQTLSEAQVDARVVVVASGIETEQFRPYDWAVTSGEATRAQIGTPPKLDVIETAGSGTGFHWIQMPWVFPPKWDGGQVRFRMLWAPSTTNTGDILFALLFTAISEGDPISVALSNTGPSITDTALGTVDDFQWSPWSGWTDIDDAGNIGYMMRLQANASSGGYTFTGVARQMLVQMQWVSDAPTDD